MTMTIHEAARRALADIGRPAHSREILQHILAQGYYAFGAKNPLSVLDVEIRRHSKDSPISKRSTPVSFFKAAPATYGLLQHQTSIPKAK
jgi:restriction system protein